MQNQFSEGGIGFEYVRDLHSELSSAMARHSLKLTGSPLPLRVVFNCVSISMAIIKRPSYPPSLRLTSGVRVKGTTVLHKRSGIIEQPNKEFGC